MMNHSTDWWVPFFDSHYANLALERTDLNKLDQEAAFLMDALQLKTDQVVFDQCCGTGDLSIALAKKGLQTIGIDLNAAYIQKAKAKVEQLPLRCTFYQEDALDFVCPNQADGGFNWFTSFGYSDNDAINLKLLHNSFHSLKEGARFVLDYTNPPFIFKHFKEQITLETPFDGGVLKVNKTAGVDLKRGMLTSSWTYLFPSGESITKQGESRIYLANDLINMLQSCGFKIIALQGDINGSLLTKDSPRCIITAQK